MEGKCIKVLQINAGSNNFGGVSAIVLNIYRNIDKSKVQFDFLTPNKTTYAMYRDEIKALGGRIFEFGINSKTFPGKLKLAKKLKEFLSENKYDIIHINSGALLFNCIVAKACKKYSNAKIFVHSHNNGGRNGFKELICMPLKKSLVKHSDLLLACSASSAEYMFPKANAGEAVIVNNGIDAKKFAYNESVRKKIREEYGLSDNFVIGNIGRFMPQKNHEFIIDIFAEIFEKRKDARLMLVGQGELEESIKEKVNRLGLTDSVLFMGQRNDIDKLCQAMDVFFLPSLFEGFGIVNLEAQAAGLVCVTSDGVPNDADAAGNMKRLSLKLPHDKWIDSLLNIDTSKRTDLSDKIISAGFDIKETGKLMQKLYEGAAV